MKRRLTTLLALILMTGGASVHAVPVTYTGSQLNVDPKTTTPPTEPDSFGWRNQTPAKPLDVDGDNVIGTDGYQGRAGNSLPSYISSFVNISGGGNPFGYMDDPTDPQGIDDVRVGFQGNTSLTNNLFSITITGSDLVTQTLGLVVQFDTYGSGTQFYTLEQRDGGVGGSVLSSSASVELNNANNGYDWAFFEITGANDGDFFVLKSSRGTAGRITYGQVAFDTQPLIPPPPSGTLFMLE